MQQELFEQWRDIIGYEGLYQISSFGRVKSHRRKGNWTEKLLKFNKDGVGYPKVILSKNNKTKSFRIHSLVAKHFLVKKHHKDTVNHIDLDKTNNHINNLEYISSSANSKHAWKNGAMDSQYGENHYRTKLTNVTVKQIKILFSKGAKIKDIVKMFNITTSIAEKIKYGTAWKHIVIS